MNRIIKYKILFLLCLVSVIIFLCTKPVSADDTFGITDGAIYNIKNVGSGKCLNVNLGNDANGTNVIQWTSDGSIEQRFRAVYYPNAYSYRIYAMCSDKGANRVLDVLRTGGSASGAIQSGNNVDIWSTGDDNCQFFQIYKHNSYYSIRLASNTNLALTAYGTGNGSGAGTSSTSSGNVFISTWTGANSQLWQFIEDTNSTPAHPYRITKGIGNQKYYVDSGASNYASDIAIGAERWKPTISFTKASDNSSSAADFYEGYTGFYTEKYGEIEPSNWAAITTDHIPSTDSLLLADNRGWSFSMIRINKNIYPGLSQNNKYKVIIHELGHVFGLKHSLFATSIMCSPVDYCLTNYPSSADRNALNQKY